MLDRNPPQAVRAIPITDSRFAVTRFEEDDGTVVVAITGDIDMATAQAFRDALDDGIQHAQDVVVDLGAVSFMDSTGLNALIRAAQRVQKGVGAISLRAPSPSVRRLLEISGVENIFAIEPNSAETGADDPT
jgi:anti-sigma B factor antagonist